MTSSVPNIEAPIARGTAYLFTDPLPAVFALDRMLNDGIVGRPSIHHCDGIQCDTDADEIEDFVDERAVYGKALVNPVLYGYK